MIKRFIIMSPGDNVATALQDCPAGETAGIFDQHNQAVGTLVCKENIPFGNKVALVRIDTGEEVLKYGAVIGLAFKSIEPGTLLHVHNTKSLAVELSPAFCREVMKQMGRGDSDEL